MTVWFLSIRITLSEKMPMSKSYLLYNFTYSLGMTKFRDGEQVNVSQELKGSRREGDDCGQEEFL